MRKTARWIYKRTYDAVNHRLRSLADGRWAGHCLPTSIAILLTELCNARCVHCDIWKNSGREDSPTPEQWKRFLSDLRGWLGPVHVVFTGGEALMRPYTPEIVAHASSIGLFAETLTHGYWKDQAKIERLARAKPWRITLSLDAASETHTHIRGHKQFWERTHESLETLVRLRRDERLGYQIRLKTVVMSQNLEEVAEVARFAQRQGCEVFYQPIEQNYNTLEDPRWFEHSDNWPKDSQRAIAVARDLIRLKQEGLPIANSVAQLQHMIPYFEDPDAHRVATQSHQAHEGKALCAAQTTLQLQANGDVTVCYGMKPVGNIRSASIRQIWESRPRWWESGCCQERRCSDREKEAHALISIS